MIKACLFDLDGTILDTLTTIAYYGNKALSDLGFDAVEDENKYKYFAGNGAKKLVERMLIEVNAYNEDNYNKVYKYYMEQYDANPTYLTKPFNGICKMLTELKNSGIKHGVISNKPDFATKAVCKDVFEEGLLSEVRGQIDGVPIKPDISGALCVLESLGAKPHEAIYVGDTSVDMMTGKNLGAYTVGVLWGFRHKEELVRSGADEIVAFPHEITSIVDKLNSK